MEANFIDDFILNENSSDSSDTESETTCNEDARKLNSDLEEDDLSDDDLYADHPDEDGTEVLDSSNSDVDSIQNTPFAIKLRDWALRFHITLIALSALLLLLRLFDNTLPLDARTLLSTPKK